jgi:membrane fusion protein, heavy metal efflux system
MTHRIGMSAVWAAGLSAWAVCGLAGCKPGGASASPTAKPVAPAKVSGTPKEAELATVTLTPDAEKRLGVALATVERKAVPRTAAYAGEVMIPTGRLIAVTSPFVAMIKPVAGGANPGTAALEPGMAVKEGQPVFLLVPILSPEAKAQFAQLLTEAEGQVKQAEDQLRIAKVNLDRNENLYRHKDVSAAAVEDAKNQHGLQEKALKLANDRFATVSRVAADAEKGVGNEQTITSPAKGVLQNVHVTPGQKVAAGAALFEVADLDPVWVKVPVYVGDMKKLAADKPAAIGDLSDPPGAPGERPAKPISAPPAADPLAATVSVYYSVENKDGAFRPGQRVAVVLPLLGDETSLTVPHASLVWDYHGGAWVYEKVGDHAYARRRVLVDRVVGDLVVLVSGPKVGAKVVTDGAAEIHGEEFKYGNK